MQVKAAAKARGVQLPHVPDLAGVSRSHFWDVLAGRKSPTVTWLTKIAIALHVEPAQLLSAETGASPERGSGEPAGYINVHTRRTIKDGMFAAVVSGRSMEPLIRDGAIGLFRPMDEKDPDGKVVLLQLRDARDPESG